MRLALLAVALVLVAPAAAGPDVRAGADFRLADGSAACRYDAGVLACRTRGVAYALRLAATGTAAARNVPVDWGRSTPVLRSSWTRGGISCTAARRIRCENRSGTQVVVGGRMVAVLAPPAVSP